MRLMLVACVFVLGVYFGLRAEEGVSWRWWLKPSLSWFRASRRDDNISYLID